MTEISNTVMLSVLFILQIHTFCSKNLSYVATVFAILIILIVVFLKQFILNYVVRVCYYETTLNDLGAC